MKEAIAYYRVSTKEQGQSGLGLDAQRLLVGDFVETQDYTLIKEFIEIESGKKADRPQLLRALNTSKRHHAVLLIAKLDRLARNVAFIAKLMEAKVEFKVVDNPHANKFMLHVMAVFAEQERDLISERTKAALNAAKLRGIKLGGNGNVLAKVNRLKAKQFAKKMAPVIAEIRLRGISTQQGITEELNRLNIPTYRNDSSKWHFTTVKRLLKRIEIENKSKPSI